MKKILILVVVLAGLGAAGWFFVLRDDSAPQADQSDTNTVPVEPSFDKTLYSVSDPASLWVVVNKKHTISTDYVPKDLVLPDLKRAGDRADDEMKMRQDAAAALKELFAGAKQEGYDLVLVSAYRSAELQKQAHDNAIKMYGQAEADRISAVPGTSEHQTGLAGDISQAGLECYLDQCFINLPEGKWLAQHAYEYGFTIRYPQGKEAITGYDYEPWHVRYIGDALAIELHDKQQTLEEFLPDQLAN